MDKLSEKPPSEQLDIILEFLLKYELADNNLSFIKSSLEVNQQIEISYEDLFSVLKKLEKDGFVTLHEKPNPLNQNRIGQTFKTKDLYVISFEGKSLLKINLGYTGKFLSDRKNIASERRNERHLRKGSVFAAIFAGGYLIWDIVKFLVEKKCIDGYQIVAFLFQSFKLIDKMFD